MVRLVEVDPDARALGDLVEGRGEAAAGGVAEDVEVGAGSFDEGCDHAVEGSGVGLEGGFELEALADRHDGDAVLGDRAPLSSTWSPGWTRLGEMSMPS